MIKFKHYYIGGFPLPHDYLIYDSEKEIGEITFIKKENIFIIGLLQIYKNYRNQHYGYKVIEYILSHYKIKCIVGQTLIESRGFWNKCIIRFNGKRKNISTLDNCTSSFVIPE